MSEGMQSPVFVGRRDEVASLAALLDRAREGEPGFAIVAGEAGVGKTRLIMELAGRAGGRCRPRARSARCSRRPTPQLPSAWPGAT
jgi:predicted ATPase